MWCSLRFNLERTFFEQRMPHLQQTILNKTTSLGRYPLVLRLYLESMSVGFECDSSLPHGLVSARFPVVTLEPRTVLFNRRLRIARQRYGMLTSVTARAINVTTHKR